LLASQVSVKVFAVDYAGRLPQELIDAINDFTDAFIDAMSRPNSIDVNINVGCDDLGSMTLEPGFSMFTISPIVITKFPFLILSF
jgi:hypothetical protein